MDFLWRGTVLNCLVFLLAMQMPARAQTNSLEREMFDFFAAHCIGSLSNFDRDRAAARTFGWKPLSPDTLKMGAPDSKDAKLEGWLAEMKTGGNSFWRFLSPIKTMVVL